MQKYDGLSRLYFDTKYGFEALAALRQSNGVHVSTNSTDDSGFPPLSVAQAATRIGGEISIRRVRYLCATGVLHSFRLGRGPYFIDRVALEQQLVTGNDEGRPDEDWRVALTYSVRQTAVRLGISERRVRDLVARATIPAVYLGDRRVYVLRRPLERILKSRRPLM